MHREYFSLIHVFGRAILQTWQWYIGWYRCFYILLLVYRLAVEPPVVGLYIFFYLNLVAITIFNFRGRF